MYDLPSSVQTGRSRARYLEVIRAKLGTLTGPALALGTVAFGVLSGLLATRLPAATILMALAGLGILLIAVSRSELIILLMLVISSSIIDPRTIPSINVGFRFTAVEISLIFLLGLAVAKYLAGAEETGFVRTPLDLPVFLFFLASVISFLNALYNLEESRGWLVPQWRVLFDYLVFFVVTNLVRTRRQLMTLTGGLLVLATITATFMVVQAAVGTSVKIIPYVSIGYASVFDQEFVGVTRVIPPGAILVFVTLFPILVFQSIPENPRARKWMLFAAVILLLVAIAFTFSRTWWMGMAISLIVLLFIIPEDQRRAILTIIFVLAVVLFLSAWFLNAYFPRVENVVEVLYLRAASFFTGDQIRSAGGTQWRVREIESAIVKIRDHPLLGVGPGGTLRDEWWSGDNLTRYMHNSYLFILADLGFVGFLPFIWFSVAYLVRGFLLGSKLRDPGLRAWVLGLTLSYITLLVASISGPEFMTWHTAPVAGVMLGINEVAIRLGQRSA